jgi:hypothetical protein
VFGVETNGINERTRAKIDELKRSTGSETYLSLKAGINAGMVEWYLTEAIRLGDDFAKSDDFSHAIQTIGLLYGFELGYNDVEKNKKEDIFQRLVSKINNKYFLLNYLSMFLTVCGKNYVTNHYCKYFNEVNEESLSKDFDEQEKFVRENIDSFIEKIIENQDILFLFFNSTNTETYKNFNGYHSNDSFLIASIIIFKQGINQKEINHIFRLLIKANELVDANDRKLLNRFILSAFGTFLNPQTFTVKDIEKLLRNFLIATKQENGKEILNQIIYKNEATGDRIVSKLNSLEELTMLIKVSNQHLNTILINNPELDKEKIIGLIINYITGLFKLKLQPENEEFNYLCQLLTEKFKEMYLKNIKGGKEVYRYRDVFF